MSRGRRRFLAVCLLAAPPVFILAAWLCDGVSTGTAVASYLGITLTAAGGLAAGIVAARYLGHGGSGAEQLVGLIAVTTLSVATIGTLYLGLVRGPVASIGTAERAFRQIPGFVEYLTAQGAGMLLVGRRSDEAPVP